MNGLDFLYSGAAILTAPVWARQRRRGWGERLGRVGPMLTCRAAGDRPRVLLHAVSVGEVSALRALVPLLSREAEVVVSTTTDTGLARARALYAGTAGVVRYPLDFSGAVRRFLDAVRPDAVGLVELELWPNFLGACERRGIPVAVINGRLSARSERGYARFRRVLGPMLFARLAAAGVQDAVYARRFIAAGTPPDGVRVMGSMKWDAVDAGAPVPGERALGLARAMGVDPSRPVIVAGSTGPGEEALLHAACPAGAQLVCAPRRPERFGEAAAALPGCVRRSTGELGTAYELADVVVVGRSFFDLHGSDPMEPAALGRAVVIGPAVSDFEGVVRTLREHGAIEQVGRDGLGAALAGLMGDGGRRRAMGERARSCVREQQGASGRYAAMLLGLAPRGASREAP